MQLSKIPSGRLRFALDAALGDEDEGLGGTNQTFGGSLYSGRQAERDVASRAFSHAPAIVGRVLEFIVGPKDTEMFVTAAVSLAPAYCADIVEDEVLGRRPKLLPPLVEALLSSKNTSEESHAAQRAAAALLRRALRRVDALDSTVERAELTRTFRRRLGGRKDSDALRATVGGMTLRAGDTDAHVRGTAIEALGASITVRQPPKGMAEDVVVSLVRAAKDSDAFVRWTLGRVLGDVLQSEHVVSELRPKIEQALFLLLQDDVGHVRRTALRAASNAILGSHCSEEGMKEGVIVVSSCARDGLRSVRTAAAECLQELVQCDAVADPAVPMAALARLADDDDVMVRTGAVEGLSKAVHRAPRVALPALAGRAEDESHLVRATTIEAFGRVVSEGLVASPAKDIVQQTVLDALRDPHVDVRRAALTAIDAAIQKRSVDQLKILPSIVSCITDAEWQVRATAARAFGTLFEAGCTNPLIADSLRTLTGDSDADVRGAARIAMGKRKGSLRHTLTKSASARGILFTAVRTGALRSEPTPRAEDDASLSNHSSFRSSRSSVAGSSAISLGVADPIDPSDTIQEVEDEEEDKKATLLQSTRSFFSLSKH